MLTIDEKLRTIAVDIVRKASILLRKYVNNNNVKNIVGKGSGGDNSYLIDIIVEKLIIENMKETGLKLMIVSEEYGVYETSSNVDYIVLVDPLDGSLNYVSKIPFVAISIVFYTIENPYLNSPIAGAVSNVFMNETYSFNSSEVYINNYRVSNINRKLNGIVSIYTENTKTIDVVREFYNNELKLDVKIRNLGSSSIESIYAALNRIDLFIHNTGRLRNLDIAGGVALAKLLNTPCIDLRGLEIKYRVDTIQSIESIIIGINAEKLVENFK